MKKQHVLSIGLSLAGVLICAPYAQAQGNWSSTRNDPGHAGWQKAEKKLSKDTVPSQFKFLWKIGLGSASRDYESYSEPLLIPRIINNRGFKDLVVWSGPQDVYAVDSELGTMVWTKHYDVKPSPCGTTNLAMVMEPPPSINFGARRTPATPAPPRRPPTSERHLGDAGGGGFGLRGIYVVTADGQLHEQILATGADLAPPVKFLPGRAGISQGLSLSDSRLYTSTKSGCEGTTNAVWSIDVGSADYAVTSYQTRSVTPLGPTLGDADAAYIVTGSGSDSGIHPNSIVALTPDAKVSDWFTSPGTAKLANVTPVAFVYKMKKLLAAPGGDGAVVLLDRDSLGGADHHTPLASTQPLLNPKSDAISALAVWQQPGGAAWVLASVPGPANADTKFATSNGATPHGSIVAFKLEGEGDKPTLVPAWSSRDLVNPAPPVIANGLIIVLEQGDSSKPAQLLVLDGETGKELYSSGNDIPTYAHNAGVAVGDGHAFFVTHDNTLYSFGIGMEH